jgi:Tfp pilus assembly protein PilF
MIGPPLTARTCRVSTLVWLAVVVFSTPVHLGAAQGVATPSSIVEAERLRASGDLTGAARLLREQLAREPDNGDAARLLAQTLYWLRDFEEARRVYDAALARHPNDSAVRLDYARMLLDTGRWDEARELLSQLQSNAAIRADADALLATLAYWQGDLSTAQRLFESVLRANPAHREAQRQLSEVRAATASWIRISTGFGRDDQPLDRVALGVEARWFATPLLPITLRVQPSTYRVTDAQSSRMMSAEVEVSHFAPASGLETQLAGGFLQRWNAPEGADWTGRGAVGIRLPKHVTLRAKADRLPYLFTTSSLESRILVHSGTALLHWEDPRGWLGEAAYQLQRFPDDNSIRSMYAWQLAPVLQRPRATLQAGYAFARENADESRFVLARPAQPFPVSDPRFSTEGRYSPYYTPSHLVSHSLIASAIFRPTPQTTFSVRGGRAVHATEDAPLFLVTQGQLLPTFANRSVSPWNAHGSLDIAVNGRTTLSATGEYGRTAFYTWWTTGVGVTARFRATP